MLILPRNHFSDEFERDAVGLVESGIPQKVGDPAEAGVRGFECLDVCFAGLG
jgi:hypothetical protein